MSKPVIQVKESDIQRLILDWLAAERIWHIRLNTGAMAGSHKGKKWFVRFGRPGMADILAVKSYRATWVLPVQVMAVSSMTVGDCFPIPAYWIEVKGPKGTQSDEQKRFQKEVSEQGMTYILARDLNDVIAKLK